MQRRAAVQRQLVAIDSTQGGCQVCVCAELPVKYSVQAGAVQSTDP